MTWVWSFQWQAAKLLEGEYSLIIHCINASLNSLHFHKKYRRILYFYVFNLFTFEFRLFSADHHFLINGAALAQEVEWVGW